MGDGPLFAPLPREGEPAFHLTARRSPVWTGHSGTALRAAASRLAAGQCRRTDLSRPARCSLREMHGRRCARRAAAGPCLHAGGGRHLDVNHVWISGSDFFCSHSRSPLGARRDMEYHECMSSNPSLPPGETWQLTSADVAAWEAAARDKEAEADGYAALAEYARAEAAALRENVSNALKLAALLVRPAPPKVPAPRVGFTPTLIVVPDRTRRRGTGTWVEWVQNHIYTSAVGLSGGDLRELALKDEEYGPKFLASEKGFYHAISRLQHDKVIVKHLGRLYSPDTLVDHLARVERGEIQDLPAPTARSSPMSEAIMDMIAARPGITSGEIIGLLKMDPNFQDALSPNSTIAYNIVSRLTKRGQVQKHNSGLSAGPQMPPRDGTSKWLKIAQEAVLSPDLLEAF